MSAGCHVPHMQVAISGYECAAIGAKSHTMDMVPVFQHIGNPGPRHISCSEPARGGITQLHG